MLSNRCNKNPPYSSTLHLTTTSLEWQQEPPICYRLRDMLKQMEPLFNLSKGISIHIQRQVDSNTHCKVLLIRPCFENYFAINIKYVGLDLDKFSVKFSQPELENCEISHRFELWRPFQASSLIRSLSYNKQGQKCKINY